MDSSSRILVGWAASVPWEVHYRTNCLPSPLPIHSFIAFPGMLWAMLMLRYTVICHDGLQPSCGRCGRHLVMLVTHVCAFCQCSTAFARRPEHAAQLGRQPLYAHGVPPATRAPARAAWRSAAWGRPHGAAADGPRHLFHGVWSHGAAARVAAGVPVRGCVPAPV